MKFDELEALANVSKQIGGGVMPANPETILALIALLREIGKALEITVDCRPIGTETFTEAREYKVRKALAKFKEMTK